MSGVTIARHLRLMHLDHDRLQLVLLYETVPVEIELLENATQILLLELSHVMILQRSQLSSATAA